MKQTQTYTKVEVALRNGKANNDVWIIIDNFVYDVTQYIHDVSKSKSLWSNDLDNR